MTLAMTSGIVMFQGRVIYEPFVVSVIIIGHLCSYRALEKVKWLQGGDKDTLCGKMLEDILPVS